MCIPVVMWSLVLLANLVGCGDTRETSGAGGETASSTTSSSTSSSSSTSTTSSTGGTGGTGGAPECADPTDCPGVNNACQKRMCTSGACDMSQAAAGTPCEDGNPCTINDTCQTGACVSGGPVVCGIGQSCASGVCVAPCSGIIGLPGPPDIPAGPDAGALAVADLDGDGEPDFARATSRSARRSTTPPARCRAS